MSINVACLCKQPLDICPKKPQSICTLVTGGTLFRCEATFFSRRPICGHSRHLFALALFVLLKPRIGNMSAGFYMNRARERGFSRFYNPHSASLKSFVMKQTKARSWSGMPLSRVHNLHSLYSSTRNILDIGFKRALGNSYGNTQESSKKGIILTFY